MATPESLREIAHTRAPFSAWLGIVLLFVLFGAIVLALIGPAPRKNDYETRRAQARAEKLKALHEEDTKALTTYGWVDKNKGVSRIPIERAMELTLTDLAQKKPAPAYAIATPAPPGAASPAAASSSPAGSPSSSPTKSP